ncbi:hypothetical protein CH63R_00285 [Colletotrichum higginsianum IMI 349063]|uniref:Uncharacterized protein n=1 Tax=Colletotrichum higginsianum (strain IMI 349063) TaxID=759273 RepID=A0A1B7YSS5_COLHI|nr:hypothetical protein CH63R_00285 [Colletotrichum higginsianum IMI 349063]OBR15105.1 hypothetical protein CH63R_00285 [Colletotrichum higginsianum IMI 349063]GJC92626.1 hypothetical protein ColKHC_01452 [Colletotrichum higginsianum]
MSPRITFAEETIQDLPVPPQERGFPSLGNMGELLESFPLPSSERLDAAHHQQRQDGGNESVKLAWHDSFSVASMRVSEMLEPRELPK